MSNAAEALDMDFENNVQGEHEEDSKKFLAFRSDDLFYAIDADDVSEIIMNDSITRLPKIPGYIRGIINLRGQILPIMDLRVRMGRPQTEFTSLTCIIVIVVDNVSLGILVDSVSQMVDIADSSISPPPVTRHQDLVMGITRLNGVVHLIIDAEGLIRK